MRGAFAPILTVPGQSCEQGTGRARERTSGIQSTAEAVVHEVARDASGNGRRIPHTSVSRSGGGTWFLEELKKSKFWKNSKSPRQEDYCFTQMYIALVRPISGKSGESGQ